MRLKEGDPKGRHVVIVDDLVQSGGTLIECQVTKYLRMNLLLKICYGMRIYSLLIPESVGCTWSSKNQCLRNTRDFSK